MLVTGGLGFQSLVIVVCFVFPVIGFFVRSQWQRSEARKEEIRRLLILASEESARAELEVSTGFTALPVYQSDHCAVCYSPTTTRCAQCKAVRYCSGKCQIIHWRQGHKENCHPPNSTNQVNETGIEPNQKVRSQNQYENYGGKFETEGWQNTKPVETFYEDSLSDSGCSWSPETLSGKDADIKADFPADRKEPTCILGSSASTLSNESSDNASVSDASCQIEPENAQGYLSDDTAFKTMDTDCDVGNLDQNKPLSPKFAGLVDSVESFTKLGKLNSLKPRVVDEESERASVSSSGWNTSGKREGSIGEPQKVFSGFWKKMLESNGSLDGSSDDSYLSKVNGANNARLSSSQSSLHFSFNLSGSTSHIHTQSSKAKGILDDAIPAISGNNGPTDGANHNPSSSSVGGSVNKGDLSNICSLPSLRTETSSQDDDNSSTARTLLKARDNRGLSSRDSATCLRSSIREQSVPLVRSGRVDMNASDAVSSQVTSSSNVRNGLKTPVLKVVDQFGEPKLSRNQYSGLVSEIAGKYSAKGIFPYESFVKLYHWKKVELQPSGLINCGNSCYTNVVLQCLAFTPPLTSYFLRRIHSKACIMKDWCFTCELESLLLKARDGKSPLSPMGIISKLRNIGSQLGEGREEDAHEFLRYVIDTMQSVCLKEAGVKASGSLEEETTLMGLTFGGYLLSMIKCTRCRGKSERQEKIMDLTVEIEGDIVTLEEALHKFTRTEILDGDNKYQCSRCKSYVKAKKKLKILEAPNVLTIVLKRFQSGRFGKLNKPILLPEILDLAPFVQEADLGNVLTKGAYMLFYSRCSPRAPRLIRNKIITSDLKIKAAHSKTNGRTTVFETNSASTHSVSRKSPLDHSATIDLFCLRYQQLQRILEDDSSSDNSSLISSNSDEGSHSTDSTRDSTSADDYLSDNIFGDLGLGRSVPWQNSSDSDATSSSSSSSSPMNLGHLRLADLDRYASDCPQRGGFQLGGSDPAAGRSKVLDSDMSKKDRNFSSRSKCREATDCVRVGDNPLNNVKSGVSIRKLSVERRD